MQQTNELRLFISSTFRDMQEEREHLVKKVFPEIRALCRERGIAFTEVDLRWGVTDEDVVLGQVVRTCLDEIDKCRPFFLGLVGERYGWAPELHEYYKDPELFARWPWLEDAAMDGASITDIEFRHGALSDPGSAGQARFFFRDLDALPPSEGVDGQLEELKDRVRASGLSVQTYASVNALGQAVLTELRSIIEQEFADAAPPSDLEEERARHNAFAASRRRAYIPNREYLKRLGEWIEEETEPLVLYAESGSGKSSLVAFWCEQLRRRRSDLFIVEHYVGIGAGDSDHLGIIRHVIEEIRERYDRSEAVPVSAEGLERDFANWLGYVRDETMLLVIDGVNQLTGDALELRWLPRVMPPGVRLVISSTVEQTLVDLRGRGWTELGMQPLSEPEREAIVVRFLAEYSKALGTDLIARITADPKSAHPLFLRTLLEELRLHGPHEEIAAVIDDLLASTGTEDLFQKLLARFERDFDAGSVRSLLALLWGSRRGLSEDEIEEITGTPRLRLSAILIGLDYHLLRRDGLLSFFHDYLRRAVERRYLGDSQAKEEEYRRIAEYFEEAGTDLRSSLELLHARERLDDRAGIESVLVNLDRFVPLHDNEEYEVLRHWSETPRPEIVDAYRRSIEEAEGSGRGLASSDLFKVAYLLGDLRAWQGAADLYRRVIEGAEKAEDRLLVARACANLATILDDIGEGEEVEALLDRAEEIFRDLGNHLGLSRVIAKRGLVLYGRGRLDDALDCYRRQQEISREIGDLHGLGKTTGLIGIVHAVRGEFDSAVASFREKERISRLIGDRLGISVAVGNRGGVMTSLGHHDEALACYAEKEEIARELGDLQGVGAALGNRGNTFLILERFDDAIACFEEMLDISQQFDDLRGIGLACGYLGRHGGMMGRYRVAIENLQKAIECHRTIGFLNGLADWYDILASSLVTLLEDRNIADDERRSILVDAFEDIDESASDRELMTTTLAHIRTAIDEWLSINDRLSRPDISDRLDPLEERIAALAEHVSDARSTGQDRSP